MVDHMPAGTPEEERLAMESLAVSASSVSKRSTGASLGRYQA